jgi:hypothetical protein
VKWLLGGLVAASLVYAYFALPALGEVNHRTLHTSVAHAVGAELGVGPRGCRRSGDAWRCDVLAFQGDSGGTTYLVRMRGRHCWTAYARAPAPELPSLARACARLSEQGRVGRFVTEVLAF